MSRVHDHENEITYFARTSHRNQGKMFGIKTDDRRRHMYVIGKTGMGKTVLLENMVLQDIYNGHGLCYIDPHGDTVENMLNYIPSWRINDVVYFNPADMDFPMGFNVFEDVVLEHADRQVNADRRTVLVDGLMAVFKKIWENVWSGRMEYILRNTILALLDTPDSTLLGVNRVYSDEEFRKKVILNIKDPVVKQFWVLEFAGYSDKYATEAVAAVQNKIGQLLTSSLIRNIVAQVKSTFNVREIMDSRKIFLVNLSKGRIGEDNSRLLGAMLITKIQLAAMERVDMSEKKRKDFYLFVDEFQNFATESFAGILSEARKYRLNLIVAHQYIAQLTEEVRDAVLGNAGTLIMFRVGAPDATVLEPELAPRFMVEDMINLPKYNIYLKLMIDGVSSQPFSAATLPPIAQKTGSEEKVVRVSRERYGRSREVIEQKIERWSGLLGEDVDIIELMEEAKAKGSGQQRKKKYKYKCSWTGKEFSIPVKLDRSRPIYCEEGREEVLELKRSGKYDPRKDIIYGEDLEPMGSVAELGSDGKWLDNPKFAPRIKEHALADEIDGEAVPEKRSPVQELDKKTEVTPEPRVEEDAPAVVVEEAPLSVIEDAGKQEVFVEKEQRRKRRRNRRRRDRADKRDQSEAPNSQDTSSSRLMPEDSPKPWGDDKGQVVSENVAHSRQGGTPLKQGDVVQFGDDV